MNLKLIDKRNFMSQILGDDIGPTEFQKQFSVKDLIMALAQTWHIVKPSTLAYTWHRLFPNCVDGGKNIAHEQANDVMAMIANNSSMEADNIRHLRDGKKKKQQKKFENLVMMKASSASPILKSLSAAVQIVITAMQQSWLPFIFSEIFRKLPVFQKRITR